MKVSSTNRFGIKCVGFWVANLCSGEVYKQAAWHWCSDYSWHQPETQATYWPVHVHHYRITEKILDKSKSGDGVAHIQNN